MASESISASTRPDGRGLQTPFEPILARKLNGERVMVLSWPRAILLQMAHPLIAAGVAQHSTFRGGAAAAASRAHHTIRAMLVLTFGAAEDRAAALSRIRSIHRSVHGTLARSAGRFAAGTPYSAEDPDLLLWVHATLLESIGDLYQRVVGPLAPGELDAFCAESAPTLIELGGDPERAPRTWTALCAYLDAVHRSRVLIVTRESRDIVRAVLFPRVAGLPFPGGSIYRLITVGLLPASIRTAYDFPWNAARQRRFDRAMRILRTARRVMPATVARWRESR